MEHVDRPKKASAHNQSVAQAQSEDAIVAGAAASNIAAADRPVGEDGKPSELPPPASNLDLIAEAAASLDRLLPTADTFWPTVQPATLQQPSPASMRVVHAACRKAEEGFQHAVGPFSRKMDIAQILRAACWKAEAIRFPGLIEEELAAEKIVVAANAGDEEIALNAAIMRLFYAAGEGSSPDKYRISRAARAMRGIKITADNLEIPLSFLSAGEIWDEVKESSRSELTQLGTERKITPVASTENPAAPTAEQLAPAPQPAQGNTGNTQAISASVRPEIVNGAGGVTAGGPLDELVFSEPAPPAAQELPAGLERLGPVELDRSLIDHQHVHVIAAYPEGGQLVLLGPICSGSRAVELIRQLKAS